MHEWIFRIAAACIAVVCYAINLWLFAAVALALIAWYGWHTYTHGHAPGADRDPLEPTRRGNVEVALISAGITGALVAVVPPVLFLLGIGYWATFIAVALAIAAGGFAWYRFR